MAGRPSIVGCQSFPVNRPCRGLTSFPTVALWDLCRRTEPSYLPEERATTVVAAALVILLIALVALLPMSWFWFWFIPLIAFWIKWVFVVDRRAVRLLGAELAADSGRSAASCYRSEAGVYITDGAKQILVARDDAQAPRQLVHVR